RGDYPALDPRFPSECASSAASISGLSFFGGGDYMTHNLIAGDYSYGCLWFFEQGPDGKPDFEVGARVLLSDHKVTSVISGGGKLYTTTDVGVFRHDVVGTRRALGSVTKSTVAAAGTTAATATAAGNINTAASSGGAKEEA
ncbi:unnamed protein product, partial [Phaeothamnion confervicola]